MNLPLIDLPAPVYADYVLDKKLAWRKQGLRTALVTVVSIDGSSPRPLGSQLAVAEDGRSVGAVTGGCAEGAIVRDALSAIQNGRNHVDIYGKGSRFKDLTLPCGAGVQLLFDVTLSTERLETLVDGHRRRQTSTYVCTLPGTTFEKIYTPQRRLIILGRGHIVPELARFAHFAEFETQIFCPDFITRDLCAAYGDVHPLRLPTDWSPRIVDGNTALVSLFHDHDFESELLHMALSTEAFYIGALGSRRTHENRRAILKDMGWGSVDVARIHGPVGLNLGAKTPPEIALSIVAQLVSLTRSPAPRDVAGSRIPAI